MLACLFWLMLLLVLYSYAIYPLLLVILSASVQVYSDIAFVLRGSNRRAQMADIDDDGMLPTVAVVVSAYNEEAVIQARVDNLRTLDYPRNKITFYIGSDGSSDKTDEILSEIAGDNLVFLPFEKNRGKASVLNDLVAAADADIIVFTDANTEFQADAIRKLVRHFTNDQAIDAVCGELELYDPDTLDNLDNVYWQYERVLKFYESRIGGLLGANGAIYATRKEAFAPLPADTVVDDFTVVFNISLQGRKVIYDPEARAREEIAPSSLEEYKRRIRIGSGNYQLFHRFYRALWPSNPVLWFTYISHKVLRWYTPLAMLIAFVTSGLLAFGSIFYALLFAVQIVVYYFCIQQRGETINNRLLKLVVFWVNMNFSLAQGALRFYRHGVAGTWQTTQR